MKISIDKEYEGERVDKVLSKILNISRSSLDNVDISCNGKIIKGSYKLKENDIIEFELNEKNDEIILIPQDIPIDIVYEDEYIAVINKSYDMVVHPSITTKENTLVNALLHHFDTLSDKYENRNGIVHRLDKDTTGLIIIAKTNEVHEKLEHMFKEHEIQKTYIAILRGKYDKNNHKISTYIGRDKKDRTIISENTSNPKLAISIFTTLSCNDRYSLVKVNILTGRTHQIRVHSKKLNHPLAGDHVYGRKDNILRQQLHSYMLEFTHPINAKHMKIVCDIPDDMKENIKKMGLDLDYARI